MDKANNKKKSVEKIYFKRLLENKRVGDREIWESIPSKIKADIIYLRLEDNIETNAQIVIDNVAVHQIAENPAIPVPPEYNKDVRLLR